ncbi:hypothetical protein Tco_0457660 [Tanacetum coccineum]
MQEQWDRCNSVVLNWILGCVSQDVFIGQVFSKNAKIHSLSESGSALSEYYHKFNALWRQYDSLFLMGLDEIYAPIRSIILTTEPILDVKGAFATLSRMSLTGVISLIMLDGYPPNFKRNIGTNRGFASNNDVSGNKDQSAGSSNSFTDDQYKRLMALISEKSGSSSMPANIAVVPGYQISLLSVRRLSKDNKFRVNFDEDNCVIQDSVDPSGDCSENKDYELEFKNLNGLNFFNNDLEEDLSNEPYDDGRDSSARRDEEGHLDDSISAEADCYNLESAIPDENDIESEGNDTFYQEFNDQFQSPIINPDSQSVNLRRSTRKTSMPTKLINFEFNTKVNHNIDKQVNYSKWIEAIYQEMEALNRNGT